jgi:hypothetical protein
MASYWPFVVVVAAFLIGALLSEKALALLNSEEKARLLDAFARSRKWHILAMGAFVLVILLWSARLGWLGIGVYFLAVGILAPAKVRQLAFPSDATRLLLIGQAFVTAGLVLCSVTYFYWLTRAAA